MKKIAGILLIALLGCLGCSDNDNATRTVDQATPVAPFGIIDTQTPTYEWTPVSGATRYQLLVEENDVPVIEEWYTAEEVESASEDGLCSVTPEIDVTGTTWKVLACLGENCGLWSDELQFSFTVAGSSPRFTDHGDGTVTDNNTKLMWSQNANHWGSKTWDDAKRACDGLTLAGHGDWRLPSLNELKSLIDKSQWDPALPSGNPFINVQSLYYWSSTTYESVPFYAWQVLMNDGNVYNANKDLDNFVWPVRSGN